MLPSWISQLPLPKIDFAPRSSIGIAIGTREVCAVRLSSRRDEWHLEWSRQADLDAPMFQGAPSTEAVSALEKAVAAVCEGAAREFIPVHVSLPDPAGVIAVFELDDLPKTRAAQLNLVSWRLTREHYGDDRPLRCACQTLGQQDGKQLLLGMALEASWQGAVREGLRRAGVVPWTMNVATGYRFNRFYPLLTSERNSGAIVALDPDAWTLALWDADGRLRWLRGRWREHLPADGAVYDAIAVETERAILAYVHGGGDRRVERVYVAGGDEAAALAAALDRRLRERCVPLTADMGQAAGSNPGKPLAALMETALSAAAA